MAGKLFLPGAGASASFWLPVVERLPATWECCRMAWPGLGAEPHDPSVQRIEDLVSLVLAAMSGPTDLIAQSMGGLVALKAALHGPHLVRRLVLAGTSGGLPVDGAGAVDWRAEYREDYPNALSWITEIREDLSTLIPSISVPVLLLWGDQDLISPIHMGERLRDLLPASELRIVKGGCHDFPVTHAAETAALIRAHLD